MSKCVKALLITIAIIAIVAGVIYFITKKTGCCEMENDEFFDDDFDLDEDLKATDREYVSLNKAAVDEDIDEIADKIKVVNDKATDIFAKASAKASNIADIANDKVSDFMNKTSDIIKNEKDYVQENQEKVEDEKQVD